MPTTKELLGIRIRELRKGFGLSQEQLAELVDVDPRYISRIELGKSSPSLATLEAIARSMKIQIRDLFEFGHLAPANEEGDELNELLLSADAETRKLVVRITRGVIRALKGNL